MQITERARLPGEGRASNRNRSATPHVISVTQAAREGPYGFRVHSGILVIDLIASRILTMTFALGVPHPILWQ